MKNNPLLPYLVIARINNFTKDKPDDAADMVWVDRNGYRFVLTPVGFVPAIQYSYMSLFRKIKDEFDKLTIVYTKLQSECEKLKLLSEKYKSSEPNNELGKKSKRHILGVIDNARGNYTDAEKLEEIKRYLNFKVALNGYRKVNYTTK